jgi:hypothetical protein
MSILIFNHMNLLIKHILITSINTISLAKHYLTIKAIKMYWKNRINIFLVRYKRILLLIA